MSSTLDEAIARHEAGYPSEALPLFRRAIKEDPLNPEVWYHTAVTASDLKEFAFAKSLLEAYVRLNPAHVKALRHLAYVQFACGDYEESWATYRRVLEVLPDDPNGLVGAGHLSWMMGRPAEAEEYYRRLLAHPSRDLEVDIERAVVLITSGDYERGWPLFELRTRSRHHYHGRRRWHPPPERAWQGEADPNKTVCVYQHGGLGDTLIFLRYASMVAERVGRVIAWLPRQIDPLLELTPGISGPITDEDWKDPNVYFIDMWSTPAVFGTRWDTVPGVPYLRAPTTGPDLGPATDGRLRVGLVWAGGTGTIHNHDRSVPDPKLLAPLFEVPGVEFISLQVGDRAREAEGLPVRPCPPVKDLADTAFVIGQLDLVISVDTAVANLAGALARPAWVMCTTWPEWRWPIRSGEHTPWYPTARVFRRTHTRDWPGIMARVAAALAELARRPRQGGGV